jgi:hypothetical protein
MEKIITSFTKGRGKKTLATPNRKNASKMPHHHLSIFIMEFPYSMNALWVFRPLTLPLSPESGERVG